MITGFNTDVEYEGRVFHVQTEDKGAGNPVLESLVYSGGEIVASIKGSYADLMGSPQYSEDKVIERMEGQHQRLIRDIRNGKFDPEGPKPFGYNIISNKSLDQVVVDFLGSQPGLEQIWLEIERHQVLVEGSNPSIQLRVLEESTDRPVAGARVLVKLLSTKAKPVELFSGSTDPEGRVVASVEIPAMGNADGAILCQAEAAGKNCEVKQFIRRPKPEEPARAKPKRRGGKRSKSRKS